MTDYTPAIPASALVREIAELTEHSAKDVKATLEALEVVIASHLRAGHDVRLVRLGTLGVKTVPARKGRWAFARVRRSKTRWRMQNESRHPIGKRER